MTGQGWRPLVLSVPVTQAAMGSQSSANTLEATAPASDPSPPGALHPGQDSVQSSFLSSTQAQRAAISQESTNHRGAN